jgi:O-methyltransferase domain/Dimerisation domain
MNYTRQREPVASPKVPPAGVVRVVERVRHVLDRVHQRSAPPPLAVLEKIFGAWTAQGIAVAAELKVADALTDGPLTIDELAGRVGADADALARLLRALIGEGIFARRRDGRYALNAQASALRSDAPVSVAGMARFVGLPEHREHWSHLVDAIRTGEAVIPRLRGKPGFEYLAEHPEIAAVFNDAMTSASESAVAPVVAAYDFTPYPTIVDVGGGHGRLLSAILAATPSSRGVLFDLPEVVEGAPELLGKHGAAERVDIVAGSFFDSIPAGGDVYILKNVIHDWPDAESIAILSKVRAAAAAGSTLLLAELVLPNHDRGFIGNWIDMEMLIAQAARERTAAEYGALLKRSGYQLTRVVPTAHPLSLVEAKTV